MTKTTASGIAYDDRGSGDTALLFMPGWCGPRTLFAPLIDRLERSVRSLAVDWRGHGESAEVDTEFGWTELADDAIAVIEDAGAETIIPVGVAHAGWVVIELRRRLGETRVPQVVFLDWMVLGAPAPFLGALEAMGTREMTRDVVDRVSTMWLADLEIPALSEYVSSMVAFDDAMWARAARAIAGAFAERPRPLDALAELDSPPRALHLYAQPGDPDFLEAQRSYASTHAWFEVARLEAASHFPMFEVPDAMADRLVEFATRDSVPGDQTRPVGVR